MNKRNIEIDTLRGIACILLVGYHVVGGTPSTGLKVDSGIYRDINDLLAYIRMPLFTFLSGVVYSYRPFSKGLYPFLKSKARRLLLPMLTVGTLFAIMQAMIHNTNAEPINWYTLHLYPVAHFWFVEAIFLIFILISLCEILRVFEKIKGFFLILALSVVLYVSDISINFISISGAIYLLPYFLMGMFAHRYGVAKYLGGKIGLLLLLLSIVLLFLISIELIPQYENRTIFGLTIGTTFCLSLFLLRFKIPFFAAIGFYSYSIFIFHVFFTAASRIFLMMLYSFDVSILLFIGVVAGVFGPIVTEKILDRKNITRVFFLGGKARPTKGAIAKPDA